MDEHYFTQWRKAADMRTSEPFAGARALITSALEEQAFPAAVIEVGRRAGPIWREAFGRLTYAADAPACRVDTIFDLASLTKVIATAPLAMREVSAGRVTLSDRVADLIPRWQGADRSPVTIRHLLDHSSGLPAHAQLWKSAAGRRAVEAAICQMPVESAPGSASVYSDLGFILLGFLLEDLAGSPLDEQFRAIETRLEGLVRYRPPSDLIDRIAPTEIDPWRQRLLRGEVHDENAAALAGVAGHAGLFGTAPAVGAFARIVLETFNETTWLGSPALMTTFAARSEVPGSSRALGWDTMQPTSSCGTLLSPTSIGHTGFTGTSLWIDHERDLYVVLLTNRVHPTRANDALVRLRPRLHDAIVRATTAE
jgi:CubicO group peptidase (beta-lactamase class C family)